MADEEQILKSELAGHWYSADPMCLADEIDGYLDAVEIRIEGPVMALLLPHAGYAYSGQVAAHGIRQVAGKRYSRVIVLGPSHRVPMVDAVSIPDVEAIETPLGRIGLDLELIRKLREAECFQCHAVAHRHEHSVQIELPLLQRALGDFKLVPVVCGELREEGARRIASILLQHIDARTLVVISSDFTHYGRSFGYVPFRGDVQGKLETLDMNAFRRIEEKDLAGFIRYVRETGATICGHSPIAVLLAMLPASARVHLLRYDTSGNMTGDWSHCVSYVAAAVTGSWSVSSGIEAAADEEPLLDDADRIGLLRLARHCISRRLRPGTPESGLKVTPGMEQIMGAFVTLHRHGRLRGCIGEIFPRRPLHEAVAEQAVNAAFHDPRFPRLREEELGEVEIEISALTAPHRVDSLSDIVIGRHGIVLCKGTRSAVFLPQVAPEQGWGVDETMTHLALKAGLAPDAWRSDCEYHVFEAIVFSE